MKHKKVLGSTGLLLFYLGVFLVFIAPIVRLLFMSLKGSEGYGFSNYQVLLQEKFDKIFFTGSAASWIKRNGWIFRSAISRIQQKS